MMGLNSNRGSSGAEHGNIPGAVRGPATNIQPRGSHLSHLLLLKRQTPAQDQAAMDEQPLAAATELLGRPIEVYEERLQSHLRALRKVLAELLDWRMSEEKQRMDYLARSEAERGRIRAEFKRLQQLLAEKECAALARLAELDAAFEAAQEEKSSRVAEGITQLHVLIGQLEAKRLPQDIGSILSSKMKLQLPSGLPTELEKSLSSCRHQRDALREALEELRDKGIPEPRPGPGNFPSREKKGEVTLYSPFFLPLQWRHPPTDLSGFPYSKSNCGSQLGSSPAALGGQKERAVG
ncbi:uncharacterized protein LOC134172342 [Pezoporus occidentalis]|uniref:uncharacterized protein LOC134172342 n=1 Tax=Pezoporus occidentalis TaxID=407982 RepID=UPI002F908E32